MAGPPVINRKYAPSNIGRDTFIHFDASFRGGKLDQDNIIKFPPKIALGHPRSKPAREKAPFVLSGADAPHFRISKPSPRSVGEAKNWIKSFDTNTLGEELSQRGTPRQTSTSIPPRLARHAAGQPLLTPRTDPALRSPGIGTTFQRCAGLQATCPPPEQAPFSARDARSMHFEDDHFHMPAAETSASFVAKKLYPRSCDGYTRTACGGYWSYG
eukprot:TRINITY_DN69508_c0_g1_i1.p1 TRINITY_DN69508_c0_g1~~TRINITY_DN69508_c0_g1_i1.p1  ORF type:complete len:246 (-),score=23.87 TRINITY_DN69508_c0_g1_i1:67-708(-)